MRPRPLRRVCAVGETMPTTHGCAVSQAVAVLWGSGQGQGMCSLLCAVREGLSEELEEEVGDRPHG